MAGNGFMDWSEIVGNTGTAGLVSGGLAKHLTDQNASLARIAATSKIASVSELLTPELSKGTLGYIFETAKYAHDAGLSSRLQGISESMAEVLAVGVPKRPTVFESMVQTMEHAMLSFGTLPNDVFRSSVLGTTVEMLRTGALDYEGIVGDLEVREDVEALAEEAVEPHVVDLPREHQMELQQAAALVYAFMFLLIVLGFAKEHPQEAMVAG